MLKAQSNIIKPCFILFNIITLIIFFATSAYPSGIIAGTVIDSISGKEIVIKAKPGLYVKVYPKNDCIIVDETGNIISRYAVLPGDEVSARIDNNGNASYIKLSIRTEGGIVASFKNNKIIFENGSEFSIHENALITYNGMETERGYGLNFSCIKPGKMAFVRAPMNDNTAMTVDVLSDDSVKGKIFSGKGIRQISINHSGYFKRSEVMRISLKGIPGGNISITMPGGFHNMPLTETSPGLYTGSFRIPGGLNLRKTVLFAIMKNKMRQGLNGTSSKPVYSIIKSEQFDIASDPPRAVNPTPFPESKISFVKPVISCSVLSPGTLVMQEGIKVWLDEKPITSGSIRTHSRVIFRPGNELKPGRHTVKVFLRDQAGNITNYKWSFFTIKKDSDKVDAPR